MLRDQHRLGRRIDGARNVRDPAERAATAARVASDVAAAQSRAAARRAGVPEISYPPDLPVSQRRSEISDTIRDHQVVVVAGETGSGKTTQLPKICLELGRGVQGTIGHTQPRRLAARTVAERIAAELATPPGDLGSGAGTGARRFDAVGYKVRFTDTTADNTLVKLMTDGILLAEIQSDRLLRQYDTLIIDEAHERSLNIDFILGYLAQLLPRRPDLKVIITSATIDPERFSLHFRGAPVIEVSGRTYPVEVRYRPLVAEPGDGAEGARDQGARDQIQAICEAVDELGREGPGDILVFLSGEREIRDTADALARSVDPGSVDILPLYARLSTAEQRRVFQAGPSRSRSGGAASRRIVLATNVAETSLTVPGIKYVVDPGMARISRYSHRTKVQRLPIEAISRASAEQRKGRCGRTSDGVCIRLYSEADFSSRPEFTDPEVLRTNLASVILQMTALGLGDVAAFPFLDPPDRRNVKAGVQLLQELRALEPARKDARPKLTALGRKLAALPIDPRLARMLVEADRNGCVREVTVIAAALSIQDPRERPADSREAADEKHGRFADKTSDLLSYLNLWQYLQEQQDVLSSNQFRRLCRTEFLNYLRVREWQDLYGQLRQVARGLGIALNRTPGERDNIHISILAGLLSHIGRKDREKREYLGARGTRFAIFPGSALFKKQPEWVMAAELVETSRLWGRVAARIEPDWVEPLAEHLVKRQHNEPHWEKSRAGVAASETVTLYGVPIVAARRVNYGAIDPGLSRDLFIRHALVEGDWETRHAFFRENRALLEDVEELEHRARRRDIRVDDETLFDFYDQRLPEGIVSGAHFDRWWATARKNRPDLLSFERSMLINEEADAVSERDYPDFWDQGDVRLRLSYQFEPGGDADGVTAHIPVAVLNQVDGEDLAWQVPGLREALVTALIRSLPKAQRRNFVPAASHASAVLSRLAPREGPLLDALGRELGRMRGVTVPRGAWQPDRVPEHLRMTFRVTDGDGRTLASGKDLAALKRDLAEPMRATLSSATDGIERKGIRTWGFGALPRTLQRKGAGGVVLAYPALVDEGDTVAVRVFASEAEQRRAMWCGTRRLLLLNVASPVRSLRARLTDQAKLALSRSPHGDVASLLDDCVTAAIDKLLGDCGGPAWDEEAFATILGKVRAELNDVATEVVTLVEHILALAHRIDQRLASVRGRTLEPAVADVKAQLSGLVYPGFVTATGLRRLPDVLRYLRAVDRRIEKLPDHPHRDRERMLEMQELQESYQRLRDTLPAGGRAGEGLAGIRWMLEELRVSYFAQALGTPRPVSKKRILRAMDELAS